MFFLRSYLVRIYLIVIFSSLVSAIGANAQPITELRIIGNSASFLFNTIQQYQSGVTLTDWTTLRIRFRITGETAWRVMVYSDYAQIEHPDGTNSIPLTNFTITINAGSITATNTTTVYTTPFTPTTIQTPLIWGVVTDPLVVATVELKISYSISPTGLGSLPNGTYYMPLNMRLEEVP